MAWLRWLKEWVGGRSRRPGQERGAGRPRGRYRPSLESMEGRVLLSADFGFAFPRSSPQVEAARAVATDAAGNAYVTGSISGGPVDFDPGPGTANLSAANGSIFIAKYSAAGALVWARNLGGNSGAQGQGVAVDAIG